MNAVPGAVESSAVGVGCTCFKLRSLARRVTQLYDHTLAPAGLKVTQYSLLAHVRRRAPQAAPTVSELALALFTDRTTLTRNLKPLIERGLIEVGHGVDARSRAVAITARGEAVFRAARPCGARRSCACVKPWDIGASRYCMAWSMRCCRCSLLPGPKRKPMHQNEKRSNPMRHVRCN